MSFLYLVLLLALVEICLFLVINVQRKRFQWLITGADELPQFDRPALEKFINNSFDPVLGWVRKPDITGTELGQKGSITFHVDSTGSRANRFNSSAPEIAAFGDSYTFCRQVEDDETWEARMAETGGKSVLNYGVGNYGLDQALLRYETMELPDTVKVVIMGIVPETICRVQSYWKHYLEFGNTFAFKPRFLLNSKGDLEIAESKMQTIDDFLNLIEYLPEIRRLDGFYKSKFRSQQYRFPYIFSLLRNPVKQLSLLAMLALRGVYRMLGISSQRVENLPFMQVMKANIYDAHGLYRDEDSRKLLAAICQRFKDAAAVRGHTPLLLVMPQLLDLKISRKSGVAPYQGFFAELSEQVPVLDVTGLFVEADFEDLYINDQYGGHLSVSGNRLVAETIMSWIAENDAILQS